ncbi:hypothetical protein I8J29_06670 [Paenibacillus sp. MWE-103]|uniref:Uncharacterized protein n=1 Tax=Paenibacillus artemisiicola TaxID=1172618 RepID=A0ABS3W6D5_9BACL|nr:hypothetical protein [Paenibacillus artemisiicola]MBO7743871.1 hypothetical protein [Paenibacillus artemisiicola]
MNGTTALQDTVSLLRGVEHYCFQVAYYLLGNDLDAAEAGKRALLALARDRRFLDGGEDERKRLAKSAAIACAMKRAGAEAATQKSG